MNEDIMKAIEQVAQHASNGQDRSDIEAYINRVVLNIEDSARSFIGSSNVGLPEPSYSRLEKWQERNKRRLARQIGEVARILLRKELFGE